METAVPASRISALSPGEFAEMVADNPDCKIDLKAFHCKIINDQKALNSEINNAIVQRNYLQIKQDAQELIQEVTERLLSDPALSHLVVKK